MNDQPHSSEHARGAGKAYLTPWERAFRRISSPFEEFIHSQTGSGIVLMAMTVLALVLANSPLAESYRHLVHIPVGFSFGGWELEKTLHHWINDGLMALFFFLVGLEIKREVLVGDLSTPRQAALPILAALGGMAVPALIYLGLNAGGGGERGWGIPMATDIAFAVGLMVLLGSRVPRGVMMFLVALAIVDDLGAVVVIALFYTDEISRAALAAAGGLFLVLVLFNLIGVRKAWPYFVTGVFLWLAMLESGVHATVAGVLVALTIPARPKYDPVRFSQHVRELVRRFDASHRPELGILRNQEQYSIVQTLEHGIHSVETPLQRLVHTFHLPVGLLIVPLFALVNAGIPVSLDGMGAALRDPITLGIIAGLVLGKLTGIAGITWLAVKMGIGSLPAGATMRHIIGVGLLGGVGFTMSIFIAELGFADMPENLLLAKTGIMLASLIAGVAGYLWFVLTTVRGRQG